MTGKFYLVYNEKENRPEHSNGQSGRYYNLYTTIGPAKALRTRRMNFLKEVYTKKYLEERYEKCKKTAELRGTTSDIWNLEGAEEDLKNYDASKEFYWRTFTVYEIDLATGEKKLVVDEEGKLTNGKLNN